MNWNCQEVEAKLSEYLDGELSAADEAGCAAHIAGCENCRDLVASVRGLVGVMHAIEPVEVPLRLVPAILERTLGPKSEKHRPALMVWLAASCVAPAVRLRGLDGHAHRDGSFAGVAHRMAEADARGFEPGEPLSRR